MLKFTEFLKENNAQYTDYTLFGKYVKYNGKLYKIIEATRTPDDLILAIQSKDRRTTYSFTNPDFDTVLQLVK